ncbi:pseudouridine synthase [Larsenimonas salina]|uniref:pseudouridine synthase n=1 Tax=Larsenimonas salina TaxID=1295565 RepID=UPI0020732522|nr:pseudouridine synthase [Larsenimonas salina]
MSTLYLLHKPFQVLCQFTDDSGRPTLAGLIDVPGIYPAGRLDFDSEGLLLLTADGQLNHRITHPDQKQEKTYWVQVEGEPDDHALKALKHGVTLKDGPTRPAKVRRLIAPEVGDRHPPVRHRASIPTSWLEITITEGRNRQVRRMTAAIGHPTLRLVRTRIGPWSIKGLASGAWRSETLHMPTTPKRGAHTPKKGPKR